MPVAYAVQAVFLKRLQKKFYTTHTRRYIDTSYVYKNKFELKFTTLHLI